MRSIGKFVGVGLFFTALVVGLSLWPAGGRSEVKEDPVLAKVGNVSITGSDFSEMLERYQVMRKDRPFSADEKKNLLDNLVKTFLIVQEAERLKLDKKPEVKTKLKLSKMELLMREYVSSLVVPEIKVTDAEVDEYMKQSADLIPRVNLTLREIVVKTEKEAKEIVGELKKGTSFSQLAGEKSIAASKRNGGRIQAAITKGRLPKELEDVAFNMKEGQYSEPVKTDQGYTLLYLDERKERTQQEMDSLQGKVRAKVSEIIKSQKVEQLMEKKVQELSGSTKIEKYYDRIK